MTLTPQDLVELQALLDDMLMRPKDAVRLMGFFQAKAVREHVAAARREAPPVDPVPPLHSPLPNGAAAPEPAA